MSSAVIGSLAGALLGYNYGSKGMSREASAAIGGVGGFLLGRWLGGPAPVVLGVGEIPLVGDRNEVIRVVSANKGQILAPYEEALKANPSLAGTIKIQWTIAPDGLVENVYTVSNTTGNMALEQRIEEAIRRLRFKGVQGDVLYPFKLVPTGVGFIAIGKKAKEHQQFKREHEKKEMARAEEKAKREAKFEEMEALIRETELKKKMAELGLSTPAAATAKAAGLVSIGNIYWVGE